MNVTAINNHLNYYYSLTYYLKLIIITLTMPYYMHTCSKVICTLDLGFKHERYSSKNNWIIQGSHTHQCLDTNKEY